MPHSIQDIIDIGSPDELLRYAARAQLELVAEEATQSTIAHALGKGARKQHAAANFSNELKNGHLSDDILHKLDEITVALGSPNLIHMGGLSSLAIRLRGLKDRESLTGRVPPAWAREMLQRPADTEFGVLTQGSALLSAFLAAESVQKADPKSKAVKILKDRHHDEILRVVHQLILVGVAPPTARNVEALIMLGTLGSFAFDIMKRPLEEALNRPMGFRVWRAITKLVKLSTRSTPQTINDLRSWTQRLLGDAEELRKTSLYPGRSLDMELATVIPLKWSPPENDWVSAALLARAYNADATIRERGTAAMGLWERAKNRDSHDVAAVAAELAPLIKEFESATGRSDASGGMKWVAATLKHVIVENVPRCNSWPTAPESDIWLGRVSDAVSHLEHEGIPGHILQGTITLFRHSLLQNSGVYRRQAIETLIAGGWTEPAMSALQRFIEIEKEETWIRIRALFALGYLQRHDKSVADTLTSACADAFQNLINNPTRAQIVEMHAILFAIGDCFGAAGVDATRVNSVRERLRSMLDQIVDTDLTNREDFYPVARATAYLLTFTAQSREKEDVEDIAEKHLERLSHHPDKVTRELSAWALQFRFADNGLVRPLLLATR